MLNSKKQQSCSLTEAFLSNSSDSKSQVCLLLHLLCNDIKLRGVALHEMLHLTLGSRDHAELRMCYIKFMACH